MPDIELIISTIPVEYEIATLRALNDAFPGLFCEFGVSTGRHTRRLADMIFPQILFGFDSFEGLPEAWDDHAPKGSFKCDPPELPANVELIIGLFQDTLRPFNESHKPHKIAFAHMDADLYSSTKYVLDNAAWANGAILMFDQCTRDDFAINHEGRALQEFADQGQYLIKCIGRQKRDGAIFQIFSV